MPGGTRGRSSLTSAAAAEIREEEQGTRLVLAGGDCLLRPHDRVLDLHSGVAGPAELAGVTGVVALHLERFGRRGDLRVDWHRG